jgi:hypothetical protein
MNPRSDFVKVVHSTWSAGLQLGMPARIGNDIPCRSELQLGMPARIGTSFL